MMAASIERSREIKLAAGVAPWTLLHCPDCHSCLAASYKKDLKYHWSLKLQCGECSCSWYVCTLCSSQRVHLRAPSQISRHNRLKHKNEDLAGQRDESSCASTPVMPMGFFAGSMDVVTIPGKYFARSASQEYFKVAQKADGVRHIVSEAVFKNTNVASKLDEKDVGMLMTLAHFVTTITRPQREHLAVVLEEVVGATTRHLPSVAELSEMKPMKPAAVKWNIDVPVSRESLRSIIYEGKHSVRENLPHPEVRTNVSDHAYLRPSECIADCLAHGLLDSNAEPEYESLSQSSHAKKLKVGDQLNGARSIFLSLWCDDFDPNNNKNNRGSVWTMTLTIETETSGATNLNHVYPIAVGPKGSNHYEVMEIIWEDILSLQRGGSVEMYNGFTHRVEKVSCHVIACTMDQPESRGVNGLLLGGSTSMSRFGHAIDLSNFVTTMRPCEECFKYLVSLRGEEAWINPNCVNCHNWMANPGNMAYPPPDKYPISETNLEGNVGWVELTYDLLQARVTLAHDKVQSSEWAPATASAYLKATGIRTDCRIEAVLCATNCKAYKDALEAKAANNTQANRDLVSSFEFEQTREPNLHVQWKGPPIWRSGLHLQQSHEAGMHILFLGLAKTTTFMVQEWASRRKKYTSLRKAIQTESSKLEKLRLSWLKVQSYQGDKLGGWVSENYLGFMRVLPWMYSKLPDLVDDPPYAEPLKPRGRWTAVENRMWLRSRNLKTDGNAKELQERVSNNINMVQSHPTGGPMEEVRMVLLSLWSMLSYLMGMRKVTSQESNVASRVIRLFLTAVFDHDRSINKTRAKPNWLTSYNFVCLLNIPEQIEMLGPIRNRWEGGVRGEGFLPKVKPNVRGITRRHWQRNLLSNILQQKTILLLNPKKRAPTQQEQKAVSPDYHHGNNQQDDSLSMDEDANSLPSLTTIIPDSTAFKMYTCLADFLLAWTSTEPLSVVLSPSSHEIPNIYCVYRTGATKMVQQLTLVGNATYKFGLFYYEFQYDDQQVQENEHIHISRLDQICISAYGVLLPSLQGNENSHNYALIDNKWRVLNGERNLVHPHMYLHREYSSMDDNDS